MTVRKIIHDQNFLQEKSEPATPFDLQIANDLHDTLIDRKNVALGLAANMIGKKKCIIAFYSGPLLIVMFNPKILKQEDPYFTKEGCLSLIGERPTQRFREITVQYQTINFANKVQTFTDLTAEIIQHEIDHCNGKII